MSYGTNGRNARQIRIDLPAEDLPTRWYNVIPDLPRAPELLLDPATEKPVTTEYLERIWATPWVAQETSLERWIDIPEPVLQAYRVWRPTPLYRALALEQHLGTPAEIYFKHEGTSPTGSHKLNSALAQAYLAKLFGVKRLYTDTGAGQWGSALAYAGAMFGIEVHVQMVRASYHQKPYRRYLMESYGATVAPSPGPATEFGRALLAREPDHPGSEATAVSEALERVRADPDGRFAIGGFGGFVLLHQTVIGLEVREQLQSIDRTPDFLVASVGCGSNMGGLCLPWVKDKLDGENVRMIAAEPEACPTLTQGQYRYDLTDSVGAAPMAKTYTVGHEFVPPPIHAGGLRYHGCAPVIGLLRHEGILEARAYSQKEIFEAGSTFTRLQGILPAPESAHAIRAGIEVAQECRENGRKAVIVICLSGHGLLDLEAYGRYHAGQLEPSVSLSRGFRA
jgi:tryptophan synthase beta chain